MTRTLIARTDSVGDVLLAGPAIRAAAAASTHLALLASPLGAPAAALLPGVDDIVVAEVPWSGYQPPPVDATDLARLVDRIRDGRYDVLVVLTSDHQSPLPLALLARLAGVPRIVGSSHDYPGALLDVRHPPGGPHEVERNLALVAAAGFPAVEVDETTSKLALRQPLPAPSADLARVLSTLDDYVVLHPSASVPARGVSAETAERITDALVGAGHRVVVTGGADAPMRVPRRAGDGVVDLSGRTSLTELAWVLTGARCLVSGNTGPAHLAAAVGTPVVSLFAPVVPAAAWRPWGVPFVLLGDQDAACAGTRARACPVPGHPCLDGLPASAVVRAVAQLLTAEVAA